MTRNEFISKFKHSKNLYNLYYVNDIRKAFPDFKIFNSSSYGFVSDRLVSWSYAKKYNLKVLDWVIAFYVVGSYGCVPLYLVLHDNEKYKNR